MADFDGSAFVKVFAQAMKQMDRDVEKRLLITAIDVERRAKQYAPVKTGRLRASITHLAGRDTKGPFVEIGSNVEYAPYMEYGTRFIAPRPFLRPALAEAIATFARPMS